MSREERSHIWEYLADTDETVALAKEILAMGDETGRPQKGKWLLPCCQAYWPQTTSHEDQTRERERWRENGIVHCSHSEAQRSTRPRWGSHWE